MATSKFTTTQYTASHFIESAGAILFHLSTRSVYLVHLKSQDEWLLAKGRRNCDESRASAALREVREETGLPCRLLDVKLETRAPPSAEESVDTPNEVRMYEGSVEPFMLTLRKVGTGEGDVKLIWWYIAAVNEDEDVGVAEERFGIERFEYGDVVEKLMYQADREVVMRAIKIVVDMRSTKTALGP